MSNPMIKAVEGWRSERIGRITSSQIYRLLESGTGDEYFGKGAKTYIMEVVGEILTGEAPEEYAKAIEWGYAYEYEAIQIYEQRYGVKVEYYGSGQPKFVAYNDVAGGSPDGEVGTDLLIEVKCPYNSGNHVKFLRMQSQEELKKSNKDYYCQVQMNLLCTNRKRVHFLSYDPRVIDHNLRLKVLEIERDEDMIREIAERINRATELIKELLSKLLS